MRLLISTRLRDRPHYWLTIFLIALSGLICLFKYQVNHIVVGKYSNLRAHYSIELVFSAASKTKKDFVILSFNYHRIHCSADFIL